MNESRVIPSTTPAGTGTDYTVLWEEGIAVLQEIATAIWTDYNEHDPGVTILENLCYALTELSYKANLPIGDILFGNETPTGDRDAFFRATEILPCNAVTPKDYRKLLIDLPPVRNAWLDLVNGGAGTGATLKLGQSIRGLYRVYVQLLDNTLSSSQQQKVKDTVMKRLCASRNLCQDILDVVIQSPLGISFSARINVSPDTSVEDLFATILVDIQNFLSPAVPVYSLTEMLATGASVDNIFNGPLPQNGFVKDEDLTNPLSMLMDVDLIKIISGVQGVNSVEDFVLYVNGQVQKDPVSIGKDKVPILNTAKCCEGVTFVNAGVSYQANTSKVLRLQSSEKSKSSQVFKIDTRQQQLSIPGGNQSGISTYYSIQEAFPKVYGIGSEGVNAPKGSQRNAQKRQMKAYLLFFEQVLADYLQQLSRVGDLFSLDKSISNSYFFQVLWNVPEVLEILKVGDEPPVSTLEAFNKAGYIKQLQELNARFDPFLDRRNRFLDNLLARFGEQLDSYMLTKFDPYDAGDEMTRKLINWKIDYLREYVSISRDRGKAFDYSEPCWSEEETLGPDEPQHVVNVSGLVKRVCLMLGITHYDEHSLVRSLDEANINIIEITPPNVTATVEEMQTLEGSEKVALNVLRFKAGENTVSGEDFEFIINSGDVMLALLRDGINQASYSVSPAGPGGYRTVYFKSGTYALPVYIAESQEEARRQITRMIAFLKQISINGEGMHLIEHLLLRPDVNGANFSFRFIDTQSGIPYFESVQNETLFRRNELVETIAASADDESRYLASQDASGQYTVFFNDDNGQAIARSSVKYPSRTEAEQGMQDIRQSLHQMLAAYPPDEQNGLRLYASYPADAGGEPLETDERFFAFTASVMLPNWPARFQNKDFQWLLRSQMVLNKPAAVSLKFYWLDATQMKQFEVLYRPWLEALRTGSPATGELSMKLVRLIQSFESQQ